MLAQHALERNRNQEREYKRQGKEITANVEEGWGIAFSRINLLNDTTHNLIEQLAKSEHEGDKDESDKLRKYIEENLSDLENYL